MGKKKAPNEIHKMDKGKILQNHRESNWEFYGISKDKKNSKEIVLFNPEKVRIIRHLKVKDEVNPYTKEWEPYFRKRKRRRMHDHLSDKKHILFLGKNKMVFVRYANRK